MKCVVILNGSPCEYNFLSDDYIICCDAGYNYAKKHNIKPNLILGDFDSLGYVPENSEVFPVEKDKTDGEIALDKVKSLKADYVDFICFGGKREDHFFGNISLLKKAYSLGIFACGVTENGKIYYTEKSICLKAKKGATVSVVATKESKIVYSKGLKYAYDNTVLIENSTLGISNVASKNEIYFEVESGGILIFINNI